MLSSHQSGGPLSLGRGGQSTRGAVSMSDSTKPALEIDGLNFSYGDRFALKDVSFSVHPGEFAALLGPNGAGKTTLFSLITHLFESRHGVIRMGGWDVRADTGKEWLEDVFRALVQRADAEAVVAAAGAASAGDESGA